MSDRSAHRCPRARVGFTAIEMVVVLGIIMLLASMSLPGLLGALRKGRISDAASSIMNASSIATGLARSGQASPMRYGVVVVVDDGLPSYVAVTYGLDATRATILTDGGAPAKPVCRIPFNRNVVVFDGNVPMTSNKGWQYQSRTGFPIQTGSPMVPTNIGAVPDAPFSVRSLDDQVRVGIAIYSIGVANAQEF